MVNYNVHILQYSLWKRQDDMYLLTDLSSKGGTYKNTASEAVVII